MNPRLFIILISLGTAPCMTAQTNGSPAPSGTILDLVGDLEHNGPENPNEVAVVLPPPDETPFTTEDPPAETSGLQAPEATETPEQTTENEAPAATPDEAVETTQPTTDNNASADSATEKPKPGLAVRVERLQTGAAEIDPAKVKLLAPFPAKLLARSPEGWLIESSESAPPITREVELAPGKRITLNVRPHLLVAQADGSSVFQIAEPGYDASLGYRQNATVSAILSTSIRQLEDDSLQLGTVIEQLQQLLVSLPQPSDTPEPQPEPEPKPKTNRKR